MSAGTKMEGAARVHVGRTLWHFCHTLRHDGIDYGQYLDQLTYLLFIKMAAERGVRLPPRCNWDILTETPNEHLLEQYQEILLRLSVEPGVVGDIYGSSKSAFNDPASLQRVLKLVDETHWSNLDADVQADDFEYLLEQAAAEGKKGAGQYFTPRGLARLIVECVRPGALDTDRTISDPAAGTAGFLTTSAEWLKEQQGRAGPRGASPVLYHGVELVPRARRLALMNLMLHGIDKVQLLQGDALSMDVETAFADVIITNPPFGTKGGRPPQRPDFWVSTTNKQINFVQHVVGNLKEGGRAAIVLPDNCFFGDPARQLWPKLTNDCDVHTILRLPKGTFAPYTSGTRTNVVFLTKGPRTSELWTYDARTLGTSAANKLPVGIDTLSEFIGCYGSDPLGHSPRDQSASLERRWNRFSAQQFQDAEYQLDALPWRAPDRLDVSQTQTHPSTLLDALLAELEGAVVEVRSAIRALGYHD